MYFYDIAFMFPFFLDVRFDCYSLLLVSNLNYIVLSVGKLGSILQVST